MVLGILILLGLSFWGAYAVTEPTLLQPGFDGSYTYTLLFETTYWLIPLAIILGVLARSLIAGRREAVVENGKILRHDDVAFFEHWTNTLGGITLIVSGILLGFLFVPRFVQTQRAIGFALNAHFVGAFFLIFVVSFYLTDTFLTGRIKTHIPDFKRDFPKAMAHFLSWFGRAPKPKEGKFLSSENFSFLLWLLFGGLLIITGALKASAYVWEISASVLSPATMVHDVAALLFMLLLVVHVITGTILPESWGVAKAMLTDGYVSEKYAKEHHQLWYEEIIKGEKDTQTKSAAVTQKTVTQPSKSKL